MLIRRTFWAVALLAGLAGAASPAALTINLVSSLLPARPGQTVTFTGTVTNTTNSTLFVNGDSLTVASPLIADDTKFLLNFPLSLSPNQAVTQALFDISAPAGTPLGLYSGEFDILGGPSQSDNLTLGTAAFAVTVTPEPGTFGLGAAGLGLALVFVRRSRG